MHNEFHSTTFYNTHVIIFRTEPTQATAPPLEATPSFKVVCPQMDLDDFPLKFEHYYASVYRRPATKGNVMKVGFCLASLFLLIHRFLGEIHL